MQINLKKTEDIFVRFTLFSCDFKHCWQYNRMEAVEKLIGGVLIRPRKKINVRLVMQRNKKIQDLVFDSVFQRKMVRGSISTFCQNTHFLSWMPFRIFQKGHLQISKYSQHSNSSHRFLRVKNIYRQIDKNWKN